MLIGYVSDERYVALADVLLEFEQDGRSVAVVRSTPRGAVYADVAPGSYKVTLVKDGYGPKSVQMTVDAAAPYQFRLLSDTLLGYMWPKWVKSEQRSEFRVHSVEPYRLSLWRYGLEKEFIRLIGWFDEHGPRSTMQITPDGDYVQTGVKWNKVGYGSPHHTQLLPGPERSGLYYLHAETPSGKFFSFPWVVAPAHPTAAIAVLTSTMTWNAYNNFGGRGNYINATSLPPTPTVNGRQDLGRYNTTAGYAEWGARDADYRPVSWERPEPFNHIPAQVESTDAIAGRQSCHLAEAEWRFLAWLEREGFAYDLYSEHQLHNGEVPLDAYKIVISQVHPEYWSAKMYDDIKAWTRDRGGRFMYLGGNGLNCEAEILDEHRMRYKTHIVSPPSGVGSLDPDDPTKTYESRFHRTHESEANLLGVVFMETGIMTAAPYETLRPEHWVFAGTGLRVGDHFGVHSLHERIPGGASGHETDKMSPSSPPDTILLARGLNPDDGGAHMTIYETESGGAVFSVGSITWSACILVDDPVSRITANVITRFLA
nr:putative large subunit of N,N-dimethylformamidase [uncultured bacterium]